MIDVCKVYIILRLELDLYTMNDPLYSKTAVYVCEPAAGAVT